MRLVLREEIAPEFYVPTLAAREIAIRHVTQRDRRRVSAGSIAAVQIA